MRHSMGKAAGRLAPIAGAFIAVFLASHPARSQPEGSAAPPPCLYSLQASSGGPALCVRKDSFSTDICTAIDHFARANQLPPDYFARLIWKESHFRPDALSPKGAEGIAQFMPGTAKLRGLKNSYDALSALQASAAYLNELRNRFGNLGLAAAAYNAGENGLSAFLEAGSLPFETRSYVTAITAHTVEEWKNSPPDKAALELDKDKAFLEACIALAESRRFKSSPWQPEGEWAPWGAQLAAHFDPAAARSLFLEDIRKLPVPLNAEKPLILRQRDRSFGYRPRYVARVARQTRGEANQVCAAVRKAGGVCLVFKND
ncbi:lytic transglycosylase domain-containing protein [Rhizobium sullae]|uniref:Transglycosylase-like protein with SLT domain n=1 Tax=Rhizobium sullae TaxID=50338 RepID=A0A4R3PZ78_RHISU|nr:lytic transglycosylase domain-containing protein [Rhizobium sullae]TCU14008.1 transglycosylase-like protein with SLT domain [Rhizobium sullae]